MVEVNLLPWREYQKMYEKKVLHACLIGALVVSALILLPTHFWLQIELQHHDKKTARLKEQVQLHFGAELTKLAPNYMSASALAYDHATQVLLHDIASHHDVAQACFTTISRTANHIQFTGNTRSAADLALFLKSWAGAKAFSEIMIDELKQTADESALQFTFHGYEQVQLEKEPTV